MNRPPYLSLRSRRAGHAAGQLAATATLTRSTRFEKTTSTRYFAARGCYVDGSPDGRELLPMQYCAPLKNRPVVLYKSYRETRGKDEA